jgi:hypothetical protein
LRSRKTVRKVGQEDAIHTPRQQPGKVSRPQRTVRLLTLISGRELDLFRFNRLRDLQNSIRQGSGCRLTFTLVQQIVISNFDYPSSVGQRLYQSYFAAGTCGAAQF